MQSGATAMMMVAAPPPTLAVTSTIVASGLSPPTTISQVVSQPPLMYTHPMASLESNVCSATKMTLCRPAQQAASITSHQPTSAVSAVTEMLKRKLQQRLLAETAKKRCLQSEDFGHGVTDEILSAQVVDNTGVASKADSIVDAWNNGITLPGPSRESGTSVSLPCHSAASIHLQQRGLFGVHPLIVSLSSALRTPIAAPLPSVVTSSPNSIHATSPTKPASPARKQKKKVKRKATVKGLTAEKNVSESTPLTSVYNSTSLVASVSGALFAGNCAPILTLPANSHGPSQVSTTVTGAGFGCRKLCPTSGGGSASSPMVFVTTSGIATGFCPTFRGPQPLLSRPHMFGVRSDTGLNQPSDVVTIAKPPLLPANSSVVTPIEVSNVWNISTMSSRMAKSDGGITGPRHSESFEDNSKQFVKQLMSSPVKETPITDPSLWQLMCNGTERVNGSRCDVSSPSQAHLHRTSSCECQRGEECSNRTCDSNEHQQLVALASTSPQDSTERQQIVNAFQGCPPASNAGQVSNIVMYSSSGPGLTNETLQSNASLTVSAAYQNPYSSTSTTLVSASTLKTPNKIIKFHEYKGPPGTPCVTSSVSLSTVVTSSPIVSIADNCLTSGLQPRLPLPSMQILMQSPGSSLTSSSSSGAACLLKLECRSLLPNITSTANPTPMTSSNAKAVLTSPDRQRDAFPAGILIALPTPSPMSSMVDEHYKNIPMIPSSSSAMILNRNRLQVCGSEQSQTSAVWSSPHCVAMTLVDCKSTSTPFPSTTDVTSTIGNSVVFSSTLTSSIDGASVSDSARSETSSNSPVLSRTQSNLETTSTSVRTVQPQSSEHSLKVPLSTPANASGSSSPIASPAHLEDVRVADLKAECRKRCLAVSGPKPNLIARLRPYAEEILYRLAASATIVTSEKSLNAKGAISDSAALGRTADNQLGVPLPVFGAVPDTSFHPLINHSSCPVSTNPSPHQSPIKMLFSPSRHQLAASTASSSSSLFKESATHSSSSVFTSNAPGLVSTLVQRLFPAKSVIPMPVSRTSSNSGALESNQHRSAADQESSSNDDVHAPSSSNTTSGLQHPFFRDANVDSSLPAQTSGAASLLKTPSIPSNDVAETLLGGGVEGLSFDLPTAFRNSGELDDIDDVDEALQRAFDAIGMEFLVDDEAIDSLTGGSDPPGCESSAVGLALSSLSKMSSAAAPNAATMSPEQLLDWQRKQIRELQTLLEQSRLELMETQVKVQRKSLASSVNCDANPTVQQLTSSEDVNYIPSSVSDQTSSPSTDVINHLKSSPSSSASLESAIKPEMDESFFAPVPQREPPKYDDVIRSKQHTTSTSAPSSKAASKQYEAGMNCVEDLLDFLTNQRDILMESDDPEQPLSSHFSTEHLNHNAGQMLNHDQSYQQPHSTCFSPNTVMSPPSSSVLMSYATTATASLASYSPSSATSSAPEYDTYLHHSSDSGNGSSVTDGAPWSVAPSSVDAEDFISDYLSSSTSSVGEVSVRCTTFQKDRGGYESVHSERDWSASGCGESDMVDYQIAPSRPRKADGEFTIVGIAERKSLSSSTYGCSDPCLSAGAATDSNEENNGNGVEGSIDEGNNSSSNEQMSVDGDCLDFTDLLDIIMPPVVGVTSGDLCGPNEGKSMTLIQRSFSMPTRNVLDDLFEFDVMECNTVPYANAGSDDVTSDTDVKCCPFEKVLLEAIGSRS